MQYYKPWELLPGDEDKIKSQVQEAEEKIEREAAEWDAENAAKNDEPPPTANEHSPGPKEENVGDMVGSAVHEEQPSSPKPSEDTNMNVVVAAIAATATSDAQSKTNEPPEAAKDQGDDGGEVVEGEEDTVIY